MKQAMEQDDWGQERVAALLVDTLVWDNHGCMPLRAADDTFLPQLPAFCAMEENSH